MSPAECMEAFAYIYVYSGEAYNLCISFHDIRYTRKQTVKRVTEGTPGVKTKACRNGMRIPKTDAHEPLRKECPTSFPL